MPNKMPTKTDFSAGGLVWDPQKKALLLIYVENLTKKKVWTFPKGHPESGESPEKAALREVQEETGWSCEIIRPLTDIKYFYIHKGTRFNKTVRWFFMRPLEKVGEFNQTEILNCQWQNLSESQKLVSYGSDIKLLQQLSAMVS